MKQILTIIALATSLTIKAQSVTVCEYPTKVRHVTKGDTIELSLPLSVKYIKMEGKVYKITRETKLEEVSPSINIYQNSERQIYRFFGEIPIDTLNSQSKLGIIKKGL